MYMWPREHGLHNALTSQTDRWKTREKWPDYTNRDEEIRRKGSARTPKRLQTVSRLVAILLAKHDQLNYAKLLQYCCPSALPVGRLSATEREEILVHLSQAEPGPSMSESQLPCTQSLVVAGCSNPLPAIHDSQSHTKGEGMQKPAFTRYRIASGSVSRFAQSVVRQTFPVELFGSHHNLRVVLKSERCICCAMYSADLLAQTSTPLSTCVDTRQSPCTSFPKAFDCSTVTGCFLRTGEHNHSAQHRPR